MDFEIKRRYEEEKQVIDKLQQQKALIVRKTEACISNLCPDIRRDAVSFFNTLPEQIRVWVEEYEPKTKVSALHLKRDTEMLTDELVTIVQNKASCNIREWLSIPFTNLIYNKIELLKDTLEAALAEFFVSLEQVTGIEGNEDVQPEDSSVWKRVFAAGDSSYIVNPDAAARGETTGLFLKFVQGITQQIGEYSETAFLGFLNPVIIAAPIAIIMIKGKTETEILHEAKDIVKKQVSAEFCGKISENSTQLTENTIGIVVENFDRIRDTILNAMEVEISKMQRQMESITLDMKQGEEVIRQRSAQPAEAGNGREELLRLIDEVQSDAHASGVDDELLLRRIHNLRQGALTDTFKMAVIGDFRSEKRTLIDVLLGQEILSTYTASTFPVIKEIKYGQKPKAVLYFVNPLPEKMYYGIPKILAHMRRFQMKDVPPMEIPVDEIKDYMELSTGGETHRTNPFEKLELFLPSTFLKNGWELIDTIELSESLTNEVRSIECLSKADAAVFVFNAMAMGSAVEMAYIKDTLTLYGLTGERLFCVVNCYDQLGEREQQKVKEFSDNLLAPYTKHIYYSSAYKGLMGHLQNNEVLLQESMIPIIEADLQKAAWEKHNGLKEKIQSELQNIVEEIEKMKAHISNVETISLKNPVDFRTQQLIQTADIDRHIQFIRELTQKYDFPARQKKKIHNELKRIVEKQNDKVLNMAVVGEFSSGKSSFINALLRENLLETDVIQGTTVASTLIRYDAEKTLCVSGEGGRGKKIQKTESAAALAKLLRIYTSGEQKEIDVHHLEVGYPSDFLNQGICIIDTPGTNSLEQWHEDVTKKAIREQADACIVLTSAEKPFPESLCHFLEENLHDVLHTCIFVVTKIDLIPPKQQKKQLEYIQKVIQEKLEIEAPLVLPYSGLPVLNGTCLEYVPLNQETEQRIVQFLQEQRIKIQLQRCMSLLEQTIGRLQENMNLVSQTRKREHEQLMQALTTDLQTFVSSQKCELRQQFEEDADRRSKEFCDQITKDICSASYEVHAEFRKLPREFDIRQFLQTRLKALLEEKRDEILKKAGMQGNDTNQFRATMQSIVDSYCAQFEKNFKAEYRQLTLLAHELVNEITIDLNLNDSFLINAQADISIKNKVMANDNKDTRSFYGNMGAGAAAGAAIGSVVPVIGTTAGAIIGGIIGLARWSKKSDDTSKGEEFRKQVSGDVSAMVEQFFSGLKDSMMQTFNRGTTSCWTQIERVMDQYLTQYTSIVNEMRSRDKKAQEAVEQEIQVIQQDMAAAQKRIEQVQSIKLKLNQL